MKNCLNSEIWKVKLYPVKGSEQDGVRPCVIISPNSMNKALKTVIVAPLTTSLKDWPTRVNISFGEFSGQACLEHIRSVSKERLSERLGKTSPAEISTIQKHLRSMFSS